MGAGKTVNLQQEFNRLLYYVHILSKIGHNHIIYTNRNVLNSNSNFLKAICLKKILILNTFLGFAKYIFLNVPFRLPWFEIFFDVLMVDLRNSLQALKNTTSVQEAQKLISDNNLQTVLGLAGTHQILSKQEDILNHVDNLDCSLVCN